MKQIILLGLTGPFDPQLVAEIVQLIADKKLQVQHASNRYDGNLHIYTGTPDDIKAAVADCGGSCVGIQMSDIPQSLAPQAVATGDFTEVIRLLLRIDDTTSNVLLTELRDFVNYEKADDAPKVRVPKALAHLEPHQQRVVMEKAALEDLVTKLDAFITSSPVFQGLDEAERERLVKQRACMLAYAAVLHERIVAFPAPPPKKEGGRAKSRTSEAPAGAPVGADGKPPEAGDVPAGMAGGEEKAPGTEDGTQKEGGGAEEQTGAEG